MKEKPIDLEQATPAERLKYIRQKARLTRNYIAEKYNLPVATLKSWENGQNPITEKGLQRCIDIYRQEDVVLSKEWITTGEGLSPRLAIDAARYLASELHYPQRQQSGVKGSDQPPAYLKDDNACMLREASFFKESYPDAVILLVVNDDMDPVCQIGDYVGGRWRYGENIATALKHDCILKLKSGKIIIRRLFKSTTSDNYNLACINPLPSSEEPVMFDVEIEAAAPIIWHRMPNG